MTPLGTCTGARAARRTRCRTSSRRRSPAGSGSRASGQVQVRRGSSASTRTTRTSRSRRSSSRTARRAVVGSDAGADPRGRRDPQAASARLRFSTASTSRVAAGEAVGIVGPNGAGQDDAAERARGLARGRTPAGSPSGRGRHHASARAALPARHRPRAPGAAPVRRHDGLRERLRRRDARAPGCAAQRAYARVIEALELLRPRRRSRTAAPRASACSTASASSWRARSRPTRRAAARRDRRRAHRRRGGGARPHDQRAARAAASRSSGSSTSSTCSCRSSSGSSAWTPAAVIADGAPEAVMRDAARDRRLPRERPPRDACSRSRSSTRATACCRPCATCRSLSRRARRSRSSAPTAPARRRCCARSPARTSPRPGRSASTARDVTRLPAHERVGLGIALVPEGRRLFPQLTVEENLLVAAHAARPGALDGRPRARGVPAAAAAAPAARGDALGRRAAGDRDRPRADDEPARCCCSTRSRSASLRSPSTPSTARCATLIADGATIAARRAGPRPRARRRATRVVCMLEGRVVLEGARGELTREQITEAYFGLRGAGRPRVTWVNAVVQGVLLGGLLRAARLRARADVRRDADHQPRARRPRVLGAYLIMVVLDHANISPFLALAPGAAGDAAASATCCSARCSSAACVPGCSCRC